MVRQRWFGAAVVIGLASFLLASVDLRADDDGLYDEGAAVTVVVPRSALAKVEDGRKRKKEEVPHLDAFEVTVSLGVDGTLIIGGDPDWRSSSLPLVMTGTVTTVKNVKRDKATFLTVRGDDREIVFRLPLGGSWQQVISEVLMPGHSTVATPSPDLEASLNRMLDAYCERQFTAPLDALDPRIRRRVAELQFAVGASGPPTTSTFEGTRYFDAVLGEGTVVYNTRSSSASQRASNTITDRILPAVKAWTKVFFGEVPFDGLHITADIAHKDFTEYPPRTERDRLELYMSLDDADDFEDEDLSGQQLLDASIVLLNGNRVQLDLSQQ